MQQKIKKLISTFFSLTVFSIGTATSNAHPHLTTESKVAVNGIGPILIGMTIEEAEVAAGVKLRPGYYRENEKIDETCVYYYPQKNDLQGISFMVQNGKVARIDIRNNKYTTISGAKIGDTIEEIKSIYPQQIKIEPGHYGGKYLIYEPQDPAYKDYLLLFQAYEGVVHDFRAGYVHDVKYLVEGCS